ncbi:MAG: hypothetical protein GXO00_01255 [Candidatus Diapherotrites archaeon]|nr:hypothetical protein [Candidatus Diapherotrites archaeon]
MKLLLLHADFMEWEPTKPALRSAEPTTKERKRVDDALVVMISVEEGDDEEKIGPAADSIEEQFQRVKPSRIVIYPWVHLSQRPSKPYTALTIIKELARELERRGYEVHRAPFGWYKAFTISVKGHPLAELSRSF